MKRSRLAHRSAKRISDSDRRNAVIEEVIARDGYLCWAIGLAPGQCASRNPDRKELECHEIIPRSAWSAGWLVAENCRMLCQLHHDWVGDNPAKAKELGLHGFSWDRPDGLFGQGADWGDR